MTYQTRFTVVLFLMLAITIALIFLFITTETRLDYVDFEAGYDSTCTTNSMTLLIHSLERGRVEANNITLLENNANCSSTVPYYIFNTRGVISCVGEFSKGEVYTLAIENRVLKIRC